jgi:ferric-dicitrate binding protein FerR (iron transport regulator)
VAADIYGLGRVLRFLATNGGTETQPSALDPVIARACARAPRDRHASAVGLLTELQEALATLPHTHSGRPLTPPRSAGRPRRATPAPAPRRRGSGTAMVIAGLVLVVAAMIVALAAAAQTTAIETTAVSGVLLLAVGIWRKRREPTAVLPPRTSR